MGTKTGILRLSLAALLGSLLLAGCAYRAGFKLPEQYATYGVEFFANSSLEPDLERTLHTHMTRTLADHSGARLIRPSGADAVVRGRILSSHRRPGIRSPTNVWLESASQVMVEAELVDQRTGQVLARSSVFVPIGFVFGVQGGEARARNYALENAAQRLVLELFQKIDADGPGLPPLETASETALELGRAESPR